jgi:hypothetical protein
MPQPARSRRRPHVGPASGRRRLVVDPDLHRFCLLIAIDENDTGGAFFPRCVDCLEAAGRAPVARRSSGASGGLEAPHYVRHV